MVEAMAARCRVGLHTWVRIKQAAGSDEEWLSQCRLCGKPKSSGVAVSFGLFLAFAVASVLVFWFTSPCLGAVMMMGAIGGLGWAMGPAVIDRVATWLSVGWRR